MAISRLSLNDMKNVERGLQIVNGAMFLTLLGLIGTTWTGLVTKPDLQILKSINLELHLRIELLRGMNYFGAAFVFAGLASVCRIFYIREERSFHYVWAAIIIFSVLFLVYGGYELLDGLLELTGKQSDAIERALDSIANEIAAPELNGGSNTPPK